MVKLGTRGSLITCGREILSTLQDTAINATAAHALLHFLLSHSSSETSTVLGMHQNFNAVLK